MRTALGATRGRIDPATADGERAAGGAGGYCGTGGGVCGDAHAAAAGVSRSAECADRMRSPSLAVMGFAFGLSLVTGVLFGVAPAWIAAKAEPADALRSGARTTTGRASLLQRGLVVLQAALSLVLLVGAGLFAQSLNKLAEHGYEAGGEEPVHRAYQSAGGGLLADTTGGAVPDDG